MLEMDTKYIILTLFLIFGFGEIDLSAQSQKEVILGIELGPAMQFGNIDQSNLQGLTLKNTLNPQIRFNGYLELSDNLRLKTGLGLMTYSTNLAFGEFSDPVLIREVANISLGLEKEFLSNRKLRPFLGLDIFVQSRPKMNKVEFDSSEGIKLIPASETQDILVNQGTVTVSSSSVFLYLTPSVGFNYQLSNKILASLSGTYGWNLTDPLIIFDYSTLTLGERSYSFKGSYSGDFLSVLVGLKYRLR
ncbi:hypothetical protein BC751_1900 [Cecembia calidifontis]|jgi:hypothetical protein|uniref:Outer membrane protein with beta-barrel domain n=2 Tax=Cecembia calidifontis TaxID=1187080 RepID=A0A4Q7P8A5_9BACT|nr:hypothetical protein BC751_1900 [Cecembia calidifontis]